MSAALLTLAYSKKALDGSDQQNLTNNGVSDFAADWGGDDLSSQPAAGRKEIAERRGGD